MWFICRKGFQTHPSRGLQPHVLMFIFFLGGKLFVKQIARGWCHCLRHPELTARCLCHNCWRWRWLHSPIAGAFLGSEAEGWEIHLQGSPELMEVVMPDRCWEPVDFERLRKNQPVDLSLSFLWLSHETSPWLWLCGFEEQKVNNNFFNLYRSCWGAKAEIEHLKRFETLINMEDWSGRKWARSTQIDLDFLFAKKPKMFLIVVHILITATSQKFRNSKDIFRSISTTRILQSPKLHQFSKKKPRIDSLRHGRLWKLGWLGGLWRPGWRRSVASRGWWQGLMGDEHLRSPLVIYINHEIPIGVKNFCTSYLQIMIMKDRNPLIRNL